MQNEPSVKDPAVPVAPFKIVILYQHLTAGIRAREMAERLYTQAHNPAGLNVVLWKFDVMELPAMQDLAAQDSANANMLIISADIDTLPPLSVRDWLEHTLPVARNTETPCAFVALLGHGEQNRVIWGTEYDTHDYFEQVASKLGMDFFCKHDSDSSKPENSAWDPDAPVNNLLFLDESFTPDRNWQRWGINE